MFGKRLETRQTKRDSRLPVAAAPKTDREWRQLARVRNGIIGVWLGGFAFLTACLMGVFPAIIYQRLPTSLVVVVYSFSAMYVGIHVTSRLEQHLQQTLTARDATCLGCWIDTLFAPVSTGYYPQTVSKYYQETRAALLEQLPLLTAETAHVLGAHERHALFKVLAGGDIALIQVVLQILPMLGDARALPFVERLAVGQGMAASDTELRAEAQSSLDRLRETLALSSGARGLLRASQCPKSRKDELLIAHNGNGVVESELLRADIQE
jgi:hypothetical protein